MNISKSSCHDFLFFFVAKKERICLTRDKKAHHEDKERVMNLQQGHVIMQWPSQARLHRWVELVSLDHKSTHGRFEPETDVIQRDGWISGSQVTFTNHPDRKKENPPPPALTSGSSLLPIALIQSIPGWHVRSFHSWEFYIIFIFAWTHQYVTMVTNKWLKSVCVFMVEQII